MDCIFIQKGFIGKRYKKKRKCKTKKKCPFIYDGQNNENEYSLQLRNVGCCSQKHCLSLRIDIPKERRDHFKDIVIKEEKNEVLCVHDTNIIEIDDRKLRKTYNDNKVSIKTEPNDKENELITETYSSTNR